MQTVDIFQAHHGNFHVLPFHLKGFGLITLAQGQWVVSGEWEYCPVTINDCIKFIGITREPDCDGMAYSYCIADTINNANWGKEVVYTDYMYLMQHLVACRY